MNADCHYGDHTWAGTSACSHCDARLRCICGAFVREDNLVAHQSTCRVLVKLLAAKVSGLGHELWGTFRRQRQLRREAELERRDVIGVKRVLYVAPVAVAQPHYNQTTAKACICDGFPELSCEVAGKDCAMAEPASCDYCQTKGREWTPECEENK